jgi:hypothetical protein
MTDQVGIALLPSTCNNYLLGDCGIHGVNVHIEAITCAYKQLTGTRIWLLWRPSLPGKKFRPTIDKLYWTHGGLYRLTLTYPKQ